MLTLPPGARVFVAIARVDGRKGIDGLLTLVRSPSTTGTPPPPDPRPVTASPPPNGAPILH